jgi:hypothetical protein
MLADLAVLDRDYFTVSEEDVKKIEAELTVVDGKIVYAKGDFSSYTPPVIPILPDWSPTNSYNGYYSADVHGKKLSGNNVTATPHNHNHVASAVHNCAGACNVRARS